ncbi:MAG TPA: tetratricopeptide repeat protein [Candidatus Binatia bacterium]|nr:tetratricopeptide repeat protein [Candidatus Binatia bacterium]
MNSSTKLRRRSVTADALPSASTETTSSLASERLLGWAVPISIILITGFCFAPVLQNQFVNWDDRVNLLENPSYRGLGWEQLRWAFTTFHNSLYRPLTWITLSVDYLLWGMQPSGYHLTSLLLHCVAAFLAYIFFVRFLPLVIRVERGESSSLSVKLAAAFAALLFAVHPMRVEPVAWASGRENVVSGPFFILTLICYLRAVEKTTPVLSYWKWMSAAWLSYALSLLGKGAVVTLPIALMILDVYPLQRLGGERGKWLDLQTRRVWYEKAPFFILALVAGLLAIFGKQQSNLMYGFDQYGLVDRLVQAIYGLAFYLWKTLLPVNLSPLYEMESLGVFEWRLIVSAIILVAITVAVWILRLRWPWALAIWLYHAVILLPYIGVAQNGPQIAADRYNYLACLGWSALAGAAVLYVWRAWQSGKITRLAFITVEAAAVFMVLTLGLITWKQTQIWRDSETLWRHALAINERSYFAHHFLATALLVKGEASEALNHFTRSLEINPNYASARLGLASALAEQGDLEQAAQQFRGVLVLDPRSMEAHYNLARVLAKQGETDEAIAHYSQALAISPRDADTHNNLGMLLAARGDAANAIEHFQTVIRIDPLYAKAHFNLGRIFMQQGRMDEAVSYLRKAAQIQPDVAEIHESLGRALALQGKTEEGAKHLQEALTILKSRQSMPK